MVSDFLLLWCLVLVDPPWQPLQLPTTRKENLWGLSRNPAQRPLYQVGLLRGWAAWGRWSYPRDHCLVSAWPLLLCATWRTGSQTALSQWPGTCVVVAVSSVPSTISSLPVSQIHLVLRLSLSKGSSQKTLWRRPMWITSVHQISLDMSKTQGRLFQMSQPQHSSTSPCPPILIVMLIFQTVQRMWQKTPLTPQGEQDVRLIMATPVPLCPLSMPLLVIVRMSYWM